MIHIFYSHVTAPLAPEQWQTLLQRLPITHQTRIMRYVRWQDQHTSLLSRLLLRYALLYFGESAAQLDTFNTDSQRRPQVAAALDFNLSHSHTCAVCAISRYGRVGIDVEYLRPIELAGFQRIMSNKQWTQLQQSTNPLPLFYRFWTLKEAVTKADGRGLGLEFNTIEEAPLGQVLLPPQTWFVQPIQLSLSDYVCYLASSETQPITLHTLPLAIL